MKRDCNTEDRHTYTQEDRKECVENALFDDVVKKHPRVESGAMRESLGVPYFSQVPLEAVAAGATALEYGASKYENRNWEKGLPWQQMIDSLKRHIDDFERGRDYDDAEDGSNMHQTCMIMASAMMLCASVIRNIGDDNRLPPVADNAMTAKECGKWMQEQLKRAESKK